MLVSLPQPTNTVGYELLRIRPSERRKVFACRYVRTVRLLAEHYQKSPDKITEEELRDYLFYVKNVKEYQRSVRHQAL